MANDDLEKSAESFQNALSESAKNQARKVGTKLSRGVGKAAGKLAIKAGKTFLACVGKVFAWLISALGATGIAVVVASLLLTFFLNLIDLRGILGMISFDYFLPKNPIAEKTEARIEALAYTEPQALLDAYYKYMSVKSITKLYKGTYFTFDTDNLLSNDDYEDFAGLMDYYQRENYFYLSSPFLRATDEMFHNEQFFYPEQLIKPVYHTLNNGEAIALPIMLREPLDYSSSTISVPPGSEVTYELISDLATAVQSAISEAGAVKIISNMEETLIVLSKTLWGEARGSSVTDQSGVIWCILNRVDFGYADGTPVGVATSSFQFLGYDGDYPVCETQLSIVVDVIIAWATGDDSIRTLPSGWYDFRGREQEDGTYRNEFMEYYTTDSEQIWDWSLYNYTDVPSFYDYLGDEYESGSEVTPEITTTTTGIYDLEQDENGNYIWEIIVTSEGIDVDEFGYVTKNEEEVQEVWDWGLGSVLTYTFGEKEKYISYTYTSVTLHVHERVKNLGGIYYDEYCRGDIIIPLTSGMSIDELIELIQEEAETLMIDGGTPQIYGAGASNTLQEMIDAYLNGESYLGSNVENDFTKLESIIEHNQKAATNAESVKITLPIQAEDYVIASRMFNNSLFDGVNNSNQDTYPIYIPLISTAATMSGTIQYKYRESILKEELTEGIGDSDTPTTNQLLVSSDGVDMRTFEDGFFDLLSELNVFLVEGCSGYTAIASRAGGTYSKLPYPTEVCYPWGLEYLMDYARFYKAIIPEDILDGAEVTARISNSLSDPWKKEEEDEDGPYNNSYIAMVALGILGEEVERSTESNIYGQTSIIGVSLFENNEYDMVASMESMQKNALFRSETINNLIYGSFLYDLGDYIADFFLSVINTTADHFSSFFRTINTDEGEETSSDGKYLFVGNVNEDNIRDLIANAFAFSQSESALNKLIQLPDNIDELFVFVGKRGFTVTGTSPHEFYTPPGISTAFENSMSPTKGYYQVVTTYSEENPYVTLKTPDGTPIYAVSDGTVVSIDFSSLGGTGAVIIKHELNEETYYITYGNLCAPTKGGIALNIGQSVTMGEQIGMIATDTLLNTNDFTLQVNIGNTLSGGETVDPMAIFYQSSEDGYGFISGAIARDSSEEAVKSMQSGLSIANNYATNNRDRWHYALGMNRYTEWSDTWWAWGRGAQLLEGFGYPVATMLNSFGGASSYVESTIEVFRQGYSPRALSWIVFPPEEDSSADTKLAFVEALVVSSTQVEGIIISYCDSADGKEIVVEYMEIDSDGYFYWEEGYNPATFIYLDQYIGGDLLVNSESSATIGLVDELWIQAHLDMVIQEYPEIDDNRLEFISSAISLHGLVEYWWGGKSSAIGLDPEWGTLRAIVDPGVPNFQAQGTLWPFGLDCSGLVSWASVQAGYQYITDGTFEQRPISDYIEINDRLPGDLAFGNRHVGIYLYTTAEGNPVYVHSSSNNTDIFNNVQGGVAVDYNYTGFTGYNYVGEAPYGANLFVEAVSPSTTEQREYAAEVRAALQAGTLADAVTPPEQVYFNS